MQSLLVTVFALKHVDLWAANPFPISEGDTVCKYNTVNTATLRFCVSFQINKSIITINWALHGGPLPPVNTGTKKPRELLRA